MVNSSSGISSSRQRSAERGADPTWLRLTESGCDVFRVSLSMYARTWLGTTLGILDTSLTVSKIRTLVSIVNRWRYMTAWLRLKTRFEDILTQHTATAVGPMSR